MLALLAGGCSPGPTDGGFTFHVECTSLNAKRMPVGLEDDGNTKDVKIKDRAGYKPSKGSKSEVAKRLRMKSKVDGGAACYLSESEVAGNVSARVRVSFDQVAGLVDGESLAFLERRPLPGGPAGPLARVEAVYDAATDGFAVTFLADGSPVGETMTLPGEHDIHLFLNDGGTLLSAQVAAATGVGLDDLGSVMSLGGTDTDAELTDTVVALGVAALGKKGAFWFDQLVLTFDDSATHGEVESEVFGVLAQSWYAIDTAAKYLAGDGQDPVTLLGFVAPPNGPLNDAWAMLDAAEAAHELLPTTDPGLVTASIEAALVKLTAAEVQLLAIFDGGGTDGSAVAKKVSLARDKLELAIAQLGGFHSKSHKQLAQSVSVGF